MNEHRQHCYSILEKPEIKFNDPHFDDGNYSLGAHLIDEHNANNRIFFNNTYRIFILMNSSPGSLELNEHKYIHKLKTIKPFGINSDDPFGIPLLT